MNKEDMIELIDTLNELEKNDQAKSLKIDWKAWFSKLWERKTFICLFTLVFMFIGLFFGITMKRKYTVSVLLAPELNSSSKNGSLSNIASMLGIGKLDSGNSSDAYSVTMYPDVIASTPFITELFGIRVVDADKNIDTTLVGYLTRKKENIISKMLGGTSDSTEAEDLLNVDVFRLTKKQEGIRKYLSRSISSSIDKKTGETTISVTMDNAVIAATVADSVCSKLKKYIIRYRTQKAREDLMYYQKLADESRAKYDSIGVAYGRFRDHNRNLNLSILESEISRLQQETNIASQVYSQMKQQAEMARAKVQEQKPIFAIIEPASVPLYPSNSRKTPVLYWTFFGFVISCSWVLFLKDIYKKVRAELHSSHRSQISADE